MDNYSGIMEGGIHFEAPKPFVLLGWPAPKDALPFDSEGQARKFIDETKRRDPYVTFARLYRFEEGKWNPLNDPKSVTNP
jgi:hypothetical protein